MRDLLASGAATNGTGADVDDPETPQTIDPRMLDPRTLNYAHRLAQLDRGTASMARLILEATQRLAPPLELLHRLSLRWAALGISAWLSFYAIQHAHLDWERGAIAAFFLVGSSLIWWKA